MANETLVPDSLLVQTNLTGTLSSINADDGLWLTANDNNSDSVCVVSFPSPTGNPVVGTGLQNFTIKYRVTANANGVSFAVYLRENGTRINGGVAIDSWASTNTIGATREVSWDASLLNTSDGSLVEVEVYATKSGGKPAARTTGEFQFIDWDVDYTIAAPNVNGIASTTSTHISVASSKKQGTDSVATNHVHSVISSGSKAVANSSITVQPITMSATGLAGGGVPSKEGAAVISSISSSVGNGSKNSLNIATKSSSSSLTSSSSKGGIGSSGLAVSSSVTGIGFKKGLVDTDLVISSTLIASATKQASVSATTKVVCLVTAKKPVVQKQVVRRVRSGSVISSVFR